MTVTFELWGDSHFDDMMGIGARKAFEYQSHFRKDVFMIGNYSKAGSQVQDWLPKITAKPIVADVIVVSSGFNEGVAIALGWTSRTEVREVWYTLVETVKNAGKNILWVPTQYQLGRANEFPALEELHISPVCVGADLFEWPTTFSLCPDGVHHDYESSAALATAVMDKVATYATAPEE